MPLTPEFRSMFLGSSNQMGIAVITLLSWIAVSDGEVSEDEVQRIRQVAAAGRHPLDADTVLGFARRAQPEDLQLCCEVIRHLPRPARESFLQMASSTAIADGLLRGGENHILRLIADLLDVSPERFRALFLEVSGKPLPDPVDLGDPATWHDGARARSGAGGERLRALATLGLEDGATQEDIRSAFRRLAKIHHPDRFASIGAQAEQAATLTFQRIKGAYDLLVQT